MITGVVFILIFVAINFFLDVFGDELNPLFYILMLLIAMAFIFFAFEKFDEQTKSANFDSQETTLQEHKESQTVQNKSELNESDIGTDENKNDGKTSAENRKFI